MGLIETLLSNRNSNRLIHIISKHVMDENAANSVREASKIGKLYLKRCSGKNTM